MCSQWKKPNFSPRQQENQWMGIIFQSHDQICHCDDPWLHLLILLNKQGSCIKPESEIINIKCLLTGKPTDAGEGPSKDTVDDPGFLEGELENLFKEDTTPEEDETEDLR